MNKVLDQKEIGRRLRELRGIKTRTGTAREMKISYSALSKYEDGIKTPSDQMKVVIANYYGVPVQNIFFDPEYSKTL